MIPALLMVLFLWAMYTYVVDGIIAPTLRTHVRNRVYATRDIIRRKRIESPENVSDAAFSLAEKYANSAARLIPYANFGMLLRAKYRRSHDKNVEKEVENDLAILRGNQRLEIDVAMIYYRILQAVVINSSTWSFVFFPVYMVASFCSFVHRFRWILDQSQVVLAIVSKIQFHRFKYSLR